MMLDAPDPSGKGLTTTQMAALGALMSRYRRASPGDPALYFYVPNHERPDEDHIENRETATPPDGEQGASP